MRYFQLVFFVPQTACEKVKTAVFNAGAGKEGCYDHCAWQVLGEGQFRPLKGSQPYIGKQNQLEKVSEFRVEMKCAAEDINAIIQALLEAHPYEQPAYHLLAIS